MDVVDGYIGAEPDPQIEALLRGGLPEPSGDRYGDVWKHLAGSSWLSG